MALFLSVQFAHGAVAARELAIKRLNLALELDHQRLTLAVPRPACGDFDPAFADAVFLNVRALLVVPADADIVLEHGGHVMRAAWVYGEAIRERWPIGSGAGVLWSDGLVHGIVLAKSGFNGRDFMRWTTKSDPSADLWLFSESLIQLGNAAKKVKSRYSLKWRRMPCEI
jgi:hypothetical protein